MKNIQIVVTDNNTIVVIADTKRFGKAAILYEDHTFMGCCDYIRRTTGNNHFKLKAYSFTGELGMKTFTDTEGLTMPYIMDVVI